MTSYRCPRCKKANVIEFTESIACPRCELEFEKEDLGTIDEDKILSIQEKSDFIKFFESK